jgi:hypothetical protein
VLPLQAKNDATQLLGFLKVRDEHAAVAFWRKDDMLDVCGSILEAAAGDPDLGPLKPAGDHVQVRLSSTRLVALPEECFPLNTLQ